MKTIEDRAHEILFKLIETDKTGFDAEGIAGYAYEIAEAMHAEAEKRKPKGEWKPDWSQAPKGALTWAINSQGKATWATYDKDGNYLETLIAPSFNYKGDWKDSLRKRP